MIIALENVTIDAIRLKDGVTLTLKAGHLTPSTVGDLAEIAGAAIDVVFESKQATFELGGGGGQEAT